ncbi:MAG TPA: hypothetical protein VMX97_18240, partial [Hyphomicrobiaceae bacterium]|nr:hypothetical protein [Hyphomicrobiaceae bacterium]
CEVNTSTWRSLATISSGLCLFFGIFSPPQGDYPYFESDHFNGGGPMALAILAANNNHLRGRRCNK